MQLLLRRLIPLAALAIPLGCAESPSSPTGPAATLAARPSGGGGGGGGGGKVTYGVSGLGDIVLPVGTDAAPQVTRSSSDPFAGSDIVIKNVRVSIDDPADPAPAPGGDPATCATQFPNVTLASDWNGNQGIWTGQLTIGDLSYVNFKGSRTLADGTKESVQFSANSQGLYASKRKDANGVWYMDFVNALQYFGGNGATTNYDGKYRCVVLTIALTPVS